MREWLTEEEEAEDLRREPALRAEMAFLLFGMLGLVISAVRTFIG